MKRILHKAALGLALAGVGSEVIDAHGHHTNHANASHISIQPNKHGKADFVDISSHNGPMSVQDFLKLKANGVKGVVIKLSEGTVMNNGKYYVNELAKSQIENAKTAGLVISVYHYSKFSNPEDADKEAEYFASVAKSLNLPSTTLMINDMEDKYTLVNDKTKKHNSKKRVTENMLIFENKLNDLGFPYVANYTYQSFIDANIQSTRLGDSSLWLANYLHTTDPHKFDDNVAWQWSDFGNINGVKKGTAKNVFDFNIDYSGMFTTQLPELKSGYITHNPGQVYMKVDGASYRNINPKERKQDTFKKGQLINVTAVQVAIDGTPAFLLQDGSYLSASEDVVELKSVRDKRIADEKKVNEEKAAKLAAEKAKAALKEAAQKDIATDDILVNILPDSDESTKQVQPTANIPLNPLN